MFTRLYTGSDVSIVALTSQRLVEVHEVCLYLLLAGYFPAYRVRRGWPRWRRSRWRRCAWHPSLSLRCRRVVLYLHAETASALTAPPSRLSFAHHFTACISAHLQQQHFVSNTTSLFRNSLYTLDVWPLHNAAPFRNTPDMFALRYVFSLIHKFELVICKTPENFDKLWHGKSLHRIECVARKLVQWHRRLRGLNQKYNRLRHIVPIWESLINLS